MSAIKGSNSHIEASSIPGTTHGGNEMAAEHATKELYHDGVIVLDVGATTAEFGGTRSLKLAKDGHTVLLPQPSDDTNDPLNWSDTKKYLILALICVTAFTGDFQGALGAALIIPQAAQWHLTPNHVNYANNLGILMTCLGGVFFMLFIATFGRAPVLFWSVLAGTMCSLGCCLTPTFNGYYALRALQGFTLTAGQTVGLAFIQDIFFFHQHARMIGIWTACFLGGPYFGPMFGYFILSGTGDWRYAYWMLFGYGCLQLVMIVLLLDESWYRRDIPHADQPPEGNRLSRVIGLWQLRNQKYFVSVWESCRRMISVLLKPIIIPILIYYLITFMWAVGINQSSAILFATPVAAGGYGFSEKSVGFLTFTPIIAVTLGELFGHFVNDFLANRYIRLHAGVFKPEARLPPIYFAVFFVCPGLILIGQALQKHFIWVAIVFGWGMYVFGYMIMSVAITAYALDAYPNGSGEVSALINFSRLMGGFSVGYFQLPWGLKEGFGVSFGIQAALVAASCLIIPILHVYGPRMRAKGGPLRF